MMRFFIYLILNFGALYLGALFMGGNPGENEWYIALKKAPWTPPGWFFGIAWTTIMICYTFYLSRAEKLLGVGNNSKFRTMFFGQWCLNIIWNPIFFSWHFMYLGLAVIALLITILLAAHFNNFRANNRLFLLILPYVFWLCIAFSLNAYTAFYN